MNETKRNSKSLIVNVETIVTGSEFLKQFREQSILISVIFF